MTADMRSPETVELNDGLDNIMRIEVLDGEVWVAVSMRQPPAIPDDEATFMISQMQWEALRTMIDRTLTQQQSD